MEHYFTAQRDNIFRNVEVLIYVFDVQSSEIDKDIHYYQSWYKYKFIFVLFILNNINIILFTSLESMALHSPKAKIFCLIHKMDMVPEMQREAVKKL